MANTPSINYAGRTVDLLIFQGAKAQGEQKILLDIDSLDYPGGEVTTGIQKLVQTFAITFLTETGTVKYDPTFGTTFVSDVRLGNIRDEATVIAFFGMAVEAVRLILKLDQETNPLPDDEAYGSAKLVSFKLDRNASKLTLVIQVNSVAGQSRQVYLPVPLAIQ